MPQNSVPVLSFTMYLIELWFHRPQTCGCWGDCRSLPYSPPPRTCPVHPFCLPQPVLGTLSRATFINTHLIMCLTSPLPLFPLCFGCSSCFSVPQGPSLWEGWFLPMSLFSLSREERLYVESMFSPAPGPRLLSLIFLSRREKHLL